MKTFKGLIISLFATLIMLVLLGCATTKTHSDENTTQKIKLSDVSPKKVYQTALKMALQQNWDIKMKDSENYMFQAETPKSMNKWSDDVSVYITENGKTIMTIKSNLGHKPNRKFIKTYKKQVSKRLK